MREREKKDGVGERREGRSEGERGEEEGRTEKRRETDGVREGDRE